MATDPASAPEPIAMIPSSPSQPSGTVPPPADPGFPQRLTPADVAIQTLGACRHPSPVEKHLGADALAFVGKADKVLLDDHVSELTRNGGRPAELPAFELAGPRNSIFFDPKGLRCGIVTCGGLCPGLNNVVRGIVLELARGYGVNSVYGYRFGYEGLVARYGHAPLPLTEKNISKIHHSGGTILGSSRGSQAAADVVDKLVADGVSILFVIGGDGTIRGAMKIAAEIGRRKLPISVVGVPKTIDNDIPFIDRSFGFESAFSAAVEVIRAAHVEATGAHNGIGLVKLMGRHSGFVACQAALASTEADLVLIPEVPWALEGPNGVISYLERVLDQKDNAVIVVAEGAGQDLLTPSQLTDKSGNSRLGDIGTFLKNEIVSQFRHRGRDVTLKYIDPSYSIRSVPASPSDSVYCWHMARNAVHAAMAGNTSMLVGRWHGRFVHVPMQLATRVRKVVNPGEDFWMSVMEATGQPRTLV